MRALVLASLAAAGTALTACAPASFIPNRGMESAHQPVVSRQDYVVDVQSSYDGLASGEDRRLAGWLDAMKVGYGDRITVDTASAGGMARDAVALVVARYGLLLGEIAPVTAGIVPSGAVRVIVSRSTASVPGCPDWTTVAQPFVDGSTDSNYGCANNSNLAMMVADPQDLIEGRKGQATLSTRANTRALKAYNDLVPTGTGSALKSESTGGK